MNELFRFLLLRPADVVDPAAVRMLAGSFVESGTERSVAYKLADTFSKSPAFLTTTSMPSLRFADAAVKVATLLESGSHPVAEVRSILESLVGRTPEEVAADPAFGEDETRLADTLVAMKLLSDSRGGDGPGLARLLRGYDAIRLASTDVDPVRLRALVLDGFDAPGHVAPPPSPPAEHAAPETGADAAARLDGIEKALGRLRAVPASAFVESDQVAAPRDAAPAALARERGAADSSGAGSGTKAWLLSADAVASLGADVQGLVSARGIDLATQPLTVVIDALHSELVAVQSAIGQRDIPLAQAVNQVGVAFGPIAEDEYVGDPTVPVPSGHGNVRPVGVGDLLMVKEHVLRYEGGDLAHVENVLKSERFERDTRRLEHTETTIFQETETTKEETRDTQTTDRFSLKRETSDTIKTDSAFKAGVSVDASYGPFVEVKANADYATSTSTESSVKQAAEFSKDVVDRSISKLVERVLERRSVTTISEFEEKYEHAFDNTTGTSHISGFYQWLDKVLQAQVYNYGKRLLFDVTVPEPATNYILTQAGADQASAPLAKPPEFTATAFELNEGNYSIWAKRYDATGLEPPPPPWKTISKAIDAVVNQDPHESSKSDALAIDDGYRAKYALFSYDFWRHSNARLGVLIGNSWMEAVSQPRTYLDMAGEIGSMPFAYEAIQIETLAMAIEIFCERTERAFAAWQLKTHDGISQAYQAKLQAYEEALAQARAAAGAQIAGQNPAFNARIIANELRRQCLTLVTGQQFEAFGALELSQQGYAEPDLARSEEQMPYVRFFEQAFEWEHIVYFFYPYFWGWKGAWKKRMLLDDTDPAFGDFLRAGAARVVFPVRPGFEAAIIHYLETPDGEIWNGGPPPDISSSLYVPIVQEIEQATGAPGTEVPVGDPWEVRLPTTLVHLRPNDDLPTWTKVGEEWRPVN